MTVLIAVNTPDAIVMASDSQGTITRRFIAPENLSDYFDKDNGCKLKVGDDGQPLLDTWSKIAGRFMEVPYKSHTEVDKIFSLDPLKMGVMVCGVASIGQRTVKSLIEEFKDTASFVELSLNGHTLKNVASELLDFLRIRYLEKYPGQGGPDLELMISGYDRHRYTPGMVRVYVHQNRVTEPDYDYCVFFAGSSKEIQRTVFGIDGESKMRLVERSRGLMEKYHHLLEQQLRDNNVSIELKMPDDFGKELSLFHNWQLESLEMNCATYSEQDAIDCAEFLVNIMIKSQKLSSQVPSTGGNVQIAIIRKNTGFQYISSRQWHMNDFQAS
jgi:20S proteasome alpha/beta subunit